MKSHSKDLRKGRYSKAGYIYLVTVVTKKRVPVFINFVKARILINCLREAHANGYVYSLGFVIMPEHLHWVFELKEIKSLSETVGYIKGLSTYRINKNSLTGFSWQDGFHDHALRRSEDLKSVIRYVIGNPLRAGLVENIGDYPHWDCIYL